MLLVSAVIALQQKRNYLRISYFWNSKLPDAFYTGIFIFQLSSSDIFDIQLYLQFFVCYVSISPLHYYNNYNKK